MGSQRKRYKIIPDKPESAWRAKLHEVIFEAETPAGKAFDIVLILSISLSIITVFLDSIREINLQYGSRFYTVEWFFTILFTVEYIFRLLSVKKPWKYVTSFFGIVDLISIIPTYISLLIPGSQYLMTIRVLRLLRVFRVLKLTEYLSEMRMITLALQASTKKIGVFLFTVLTLVIIIGSMMYMIEGEANGFSDIPNSIYWAIVTLTTVGYGDISPQTPVGKILASLVMFLGYGIIAVPTGIVTVEISQAARKAVNTNVCPSCSLEGHDPDAKYCKYCGEKL
jgi:voltage-gated potassium channel